MVPSKGLDTRWGGGGGGELCDSSETPLPRLSPCAPVVVRQTDVL